MKLEAPDNLDTLCADLGIGLKRRARMAEEMREEFVPWLQEAWLWAREQDVSRFPRHALPGALPAGRSRKKSDGLVRGSPRSGAKRVLDDRPRKQRSRQPIKAPTAEEVVAAAEASGYTENLYLSTPDELPHDAVPASFQNLITMQAHGKWAEFEQAERPEQVAEQQGKQLVRKLRKLQLDAAKCGVDIAPRLIEMIREAEREIAEKRAA